MGDALNRFLYPERIIVGCEKKIKFLQILKRFKCKIYTFSLREAEMVKIAVNLFLFNSVSFANLMDNYCRQHGFKFSKINNSLRDDHRIGKKSYIEPSLGLGGGHLERDVFNLIKNSKNIKLKNIFQRLNNFNNSRIFLLIKKFNKLNKKK